MKPGDLVIFRSNVWGGSRKERLITQGEMGMFINPLYLEDRPTLVLRAYEVLVDGHLCTVPTWSIQGISESQNEVLLRRIDYVRSKIHNV